MPDEKQTGAISRRSVIMGAAIVPVAAIRSAAQTPASALSPEQFETLNAFVDRLIPNDENGPGASACGAANYIDRALADPLASERASFLSGLVALNEFARQTHGGAFASLGPEAKDAVLTALEDDTATGFTPGSRAFFNRVRRLTLEGTFGDPHYGGNNGFAGWDLIGYPGPRLAVSAEDQRMKVQIKPLRQSAWGNAHGH